MTIDRKPVEQVALEPCPFCGGEVESRWHTGPAGWLECKQCSAVGPQPEGPDGEDWDKIVALWNARLSSPDIGALVAAAADLVTAVCFADPPKSFNGVLCHEARVPVEFIDNLRAALRPYRPTPSGETL